MMFNGGGDVFLHLAEAAASRINFAGEPSAASARQPRFLADRVGRDEHRLVSGGQLTKED
ncbi:MAG: hypothetical protein GX444_01450 [Myxococcales bacterium]|nr:hypothetical protein [Myxococcales bacterium]